MDIASLGFNVDSRQMAKARDEMGRFVGAARKTEIATEKLTGQIERQNRVLGSVGAGFRALQGVISVVASAQLLRGIVAVNDEYAQLSSRLRLVTEGQEQFTRVQAELNAVAQRSRTEFKGVTDLYIRLSTVSKELGATEQQLLKFTEATGNALTLSGASAQSASGALIQLSQALGGGIVRAEEFNSILDGAPVILQTVAANMEGVGGSVAKLRSLVIDGKVTSEAFFQAFLRGSDELGRKAQGMALTVSQATTLLENDVKRAIAQADMGPLVRSIEDLRSVVNDPATQQGLSNLSGGLVTLAGAAAGALAQLGLLPQRMSEAFARATGALVPDEELARLRKLREFAMQTQNTFEVIARDRQIDTLIAKFPELRETVARDVGSSVAPVLAFAKSLTGLRFAAAEVAIPLRAAGAVMIPFRNGVREVATVTETLSEEIEQQLVAMRAVNALLQQGIPLEEATTRARLSAAGATKGQVAEYLRLERALDRASGAQKRFNDTRDPAGTSLASAANIQGAASDLFDPMKEEARSLYEMTRTPLEKYRAELEKLDMARARFDVNPEIGVSEDVYRRRLGQLNEELARSSQGYGKLTRDAESATEKLSVYADQAARNMQSAFADFLFDPFSKGLEGMLADFANILQRMAAEAAAAQIFESLGVGAGGSGFDFGGLLGSIGSGVSGLFGGFGMSSSGTRTAFNIAGALADGGPVSPGLPYLVGEQGPEIIVPRKAGNVIPNDEIGGRAMNITINVPIRAPTGAVSEPTRNQVAAAIARELNAVNRRLN